MSFSKKGRRVFIPFAYSALCIMLLLALWNPPAPFGKGSVDLLLLLDESRSITPGHNDEVWKLFVQQSASLPAGSRISLIRFADRARIELPWMDIQESEFLRLDGKAQYPHRLQLDPSATDINAAVSTAIEYSSAERRTLILISSDGIDSENPLQIHFPVANHNPDLSLFLLQSKNLQHAQSPRIESINLPSSSAPALLLPISISLESVKPAEVLLEIIVNGRITVQQPLSLNPAERRVVRVDLPPVRPGMQTLDFILRDKQGHVTDQQRHIIDSPGNRELLVIGNPTSTELHQTLQHEGWKITRFAPAQLPAQEDFFDKYDLIILDDVRADEIDTLNMRKLGDAVGKSATGLIVVGGPHSFGSGGYRHSALETLLPVTAQASRPVPGAAFVFLVDKSGSMGAGHNNENRLANAMQAVQETAKSLTAQDESALLVFDREVNTLLPLLHREDLGEDLKQAWKLQASGGTLLAPAMRQAIALLSQSASEKRFLVVVTDGYLDENGLESLSEPLQLAHVNLIALAIGSHTQLNSLQQLVDRNRGRLLHINDTAVLPRFMRKELDASRDSWDTEPVAPRVLHPLPFMTSENDDWQEVNGHQLTRVKSSATVYISTHTGDPLLAIGQYGAGRVAALPGGMLEHVSVEDWPGRFFNWMDSHQPNPRLEISHSTQNGRLSILVDAIDENGNWNSASAAQLKLTGPSGITLVRTLERIAPGRFSGEIENPAGGVYRARIELGSEHAAYNFNLSADRESHQRSIVPWLERALVSGYLGLWPETGLKDLTTSSSGQIPSRPLWLMLALITYLVIIVFERGSGFKRRLRSLPVFDRSP